MFFNCIDTLSRQFPLPLLILTSICPLLVGWILDRLLGDPENLPHPIVWFGRIIAFGERHFNKGRFRIGKGALLAFSLIIIVFLLTALLLYVAQTISIFFLLILQTILIFYCLAGTTLIREVRNVFIALDVSLEEGRKQVARIVGRDTSQLTEEEVKKAALETLAESLNDGVVAPLFWLCILNVPGMMAYKMVNTLDSMIGYCTQRYRKFGTFAARIDDVANYIPARITALLMVIVARRPKLLRFVAHNGCKHASPNSGYPESALAGILDCRFGGGHIYFNEYIDKPFIGDNDRNLTTADMEKAVRICRTTETVMVIISLLFFFIRAVV
ncbi:MAG: adenosylcobinamide-phosphate synthase CbiB [Prevotella sp.]|nr:adenosylcobinamide-phosphate synthase CbiB [Prevotella sp.]